MKKYIVILTIIVTFSACKQQKSEILYQSDVFTIYSDKVVQGKYEAKVLSPEHIVSNYNSTANEQYSSLLKFKFSINEKDNELPSGNDHWIIIQDEHISPVITFGEYSDSIPKEPDTILPVNYEYTFRLDLRPILEQFKENGYYETCDGNKIAKDEFKGVYIAGGSEPLTWDFSNLEENKLSLKDPDGDGIYEITLLLNPLDTTAKKEWKLTEDISMKPKYSSEQPLVDALFNMSLEEARKNIEKDSTLRTGAKWGGVWTRDVSYSIFLAFAYHEPEIAKISLLKKVKRNRIIQDTGSGGAWPVSSDRVVWSIAAWELYKITGDKQWLKQAYQIIKNTLDDDYKTLRSPITGMYRGESSFLDWREQTYPKWMSNVDIYMSENLSTNIVHYQAHIILVEMAKLLDEPYEVYQQRADEIKKGINDFLWMTDKGYYAQYLYGRSSLIVSPRFDALGEALAVIFDVADSVQAKSIIKNSPLTSFGATCIYPQIPDIPPYHNDAIWPFVQSYWNLAAAKAGNETALNHGLAAIYRAGALFLTNYENMVAETGDYVGTEINSDRMLWSMAGNMAMVHRVFIGMNFEVDGIRFAPVIPENYSGTKKLTNFKYREALLNITVKGFGNQIKSITIDNKPLDNAFLPADTKGNHNIYIEMSNTPFQNSSINLVDNKFSLPTTQVKRINKKLSINHTDNVVSYNIYKDGLFWKTTKESEIEVDQNETSEYMITSIDVNGNESFACEPILVYDGNNEQIIEIENFITKSDLPYINYSGKGFVVITQNKNLEISIPVTIDKAGIYLVDFRYSNGSGPWNTDNNCGIRSFYVNNEYQGVVVFPQRGIDEWSDWSFSSINKVNLPKGKNILTLKFEDWNINMDGEINTALLDYVRLIYISEKQ